MCAPQLVGREPFGGFGAGPAPGGFRRGIDEDTLRAVADKTGGLYYPAETADQLRSVFADLPTYLITKHEVTEVGFAFVAVAALLATIALLLGQAWRPLP
jgi:Ca-activated chloride channel family protein